MQLYAFFRVKKLGGPRYLWSNRVVELREHYVGEDGYYVMVAPSIISDRLLLGGEFNVEWFHASELIPITDVAKRLIKWNA